MTAWWLVPTVFLATAVVTALFRHYALHNGLMDLPNARSSHRTPIPRGGGIAIALCFLAVVIGLSTMSLLFWRDTLAIVLAVAIVTVIGFVDDRGALSPAYRLAGQFAACVLALFFVGGLAPITLFSVTLDLGLIGNVIAFFGLMWLVNLYNFMDGIDGIATLEAISVCTAAAGLMAVTPAADLAILPVVLAASCAGFLLFNFPHARLFLGDAGSGMLGLVIGVLALLSGHLYPDLMWCWLVLLGCFVVDASFTLLRRLLLGFRPHEAHRDHGYQIAARRIGNHPTVTMAVVAINLLWLFPIAFLIIRGTLAGPIALAIAYAPLLVLDLYLKAGSDRGKPPVTQAGGSDAHF